MGLSADVGTRPLASLSVEELCGLLRAQAARAAPVLGQVARGLIELSPEQRRLSAKEMLAVLEGRGAAPHVLPSPAPLQVRCAAPGGGSLRHGVARASLFLHT